MTTRTDEARWLAVGRIAGLLILGFFMLRIAWFSDDALITLRTALNITHNWGPGFNATESVQAYTHPMWFLIWLALGTLTNQWVVGLMLLSIVLSLAACALLLWRAGSLARIILTAGLLGFSNAFLDFTTSGLENPLAYLLVGLLVAQSLNKVETPIQATFFGLTIAAIFLTRFDLIILILPMLTLMIVAQRHAPRLIAIAIGATLIPLIAWFSWNYLTYSSVLPNTFDAKRNVEIPALELITQGVRYLWVTFENDPVSLIALIGGVLLALLMGNVTLRMWALGIIFYLGYVLWIGGDFMAGRFVAVPVYVAIFLIALVPLRTHPSRPHQELLGTAVAFLVVSIFAIGASLAGATPVALSATTSQRWEIDQNLNGNVMDARGSSTTGEMSLRSYVNRLSLAYINPDVSPLGDGSGLARQLREIDKSAANWPVNDGTFELPAEVGEFCGFLGNIGIATGPTVHLIDNCALTDRFLAEKPYQPAEPFAWKPGHFHRVVPEGYADAIRFNDPSKLREPADAFYLRELWSKIR